MIDLRDEVADRPAGDFPGGQSEQRGAVLVDGDEPVVERVGDRSHRNGLEDGGNRCQLSGIGLAMIAGVDDRVAPLRRYAGM